MRAPYTILLALIIILYGLNLLGIGMALYIIVVKYSTFPELQFPLLLFSKSPQVVIPVDGERICLVVLIWTGEKERVKVIVPRLFITKRGAILELIELSIQPPQILRKGERFVTIAVMKVLRGGVKLGERVRALSYVGYGNDVSLPIGEVIDFNSG